MARFWAAEHPPERARPIAFCGGPHPWSPHALFPRFFSEGQGRRRGSPSPPGHGGWWRLRGREPWPWSPSLGSQAASASPSSVAFEQGLLSGASRLSRSWGRGPEAGRMGSESHRHPTSPAARAPPMAPGPAGPLWTDPSRPGRGRKWPGAALV